MAFEQGTVPILAAPMIDPSMGRIDTTMPVGSTIEAIVEATLPGLTIRDRRHLRVMLVNDRGAIVIAAEYWRSIKPHAGVRVVIRLMAGKDILRSLLQVVVAIAAVALGAFFAPALAGALGISSGLASSIIGLGVTVLGNLLINALIPPPKASTLEQQNRYTISGWRNRFDPDGPVPLPLGRIRYAPPFGCYSYSEIVGDQQYIRAAFCPGYGPLTLSEHRIGDTDLSEYDEVQIETRQGLSSDQPLTLITRQVVEDTVGTELLMAFPRDDLGEIVAGSAAEEERIVRTTGADASGASVILAWPAGLVSYDKKGVANSHTVTIRIEQRAVQDETWTLVQSINVTARRLEAFFRQHTWNFPQRGRWQVAVTMLTPENTSSQIQQRVSWASLQTIRPEYPFNFPYPLALVAVRIKATHQLNGQLDNYNALVSRRCLDYDRYSKGWLVRPTSNPASLYRYVLQSPANPKRVPDAGIDLATLADWHKFCEDNNLKYDRVIDERGMQLGELLSEIAAAGRATRRHDGLKWSVTVDRPDKPVWDHFGPRNSYDFRVVRSYVSPPDGFRVPFLDKTNDYKPAERLVPWPGKEDIDILLTEELQMPGKTDPVEVYREARRRMYEAIHRPDVYAVSKDSGLQVAVRGDRISLSSDIISRVQKVGRARAAAGRLIEIDELVTMEAGKSYAIRFRDGLSADDTLGTSVIRTLVNRPGETNSLTVNGDGPMPRAPMMLDNGTLFDGDLIHFGEAATLDCNLLVTGVEAGEDFSTHYRLVDLAPVIDAAIAAEVVPEWSGRAGVDIGEGTFVPAAPRFSSLVSGINGTGVSGRIDYIIRPGLGSSAVASFKIDHRPVGASSWTTITITAAQGGGSITGYVNGANVEIRARALSADGTPGPDTAIIFLTVGSNDDGIPDALPSGSGEITVGGLMGGAVVQFVTGPDTKTKAVQIYRSTSPVPGSETSVGEPVPVQPSRSWSVPIGDTTRQTLIVNGDFGVSTGWILSGWTIAAGVASKAAGMIQAMYQLVAITSGETIRYGFKVPSVTSGAVRAGLRTAGATPLNDGPDYTAVGTYFGALAATGPRDCIAIRGAAAFDGVVDDVYAYRPTASCLAQGTHYIWIEAQNDDGVAGPRSGPFSVTVR
ncbi:hypothetical protein AX761_20910 [Rhizobium sp. 58]|nr:hypothetical protein AX761_20910 [Rhizobium sp. 58]